MRAWVAVFILLGVVAFGAGALKVTGVSLDSSSTTSENQTVDHIDSKPEAETSHSLRLPAMASSEVASKESSEVTDLSALKPEGERLFNSSEPTQTFSGEVIPGGYLARVELDSPEEIKQAFLRAEMFYQDGNVPEEAGPLAFVLHGPEVEIFFKENYNQYKDIVDLAARLSAFKVIDVQVCQTRMGSLGRQQTDLVPFVDSVPFGPAEISRLLGEEEYVYF